MVSRRLDLELPSRTGNRRSNRRFGRNIFCTAGTATRTFSEDGAEGAGSRLRRIVQEVWQLRRVLLDNRALLVRYGTLLRFITPGFLVLTVGAILASLLLIPIAVGAGLLAWLL